MQRDGTVTYLKPLEKTLRSGFLVTVRRSGGERKVIWRPPEPLPIDLAGEWELHWGPDGISARQFQNTLVERKPRQIVPVPDEAVDKQAWVSLTQDALIGNAPDFAVRLTRLRPVPAAFLRMGPPPQEGYRKSFLFYGAGSSLHGHVAVGSTFRVHFEGSTLLEYRFFNGRHELIAMRPGITVSPASRGAEELPERGRYLLSDDEWHGCEFRLGANWWRTLLVAVPDPLLPERDHFLEKEDRGFRTRQRMGLLFGAALLAVLYAVQTPVKRHIAATEAEVTVVAPRKISTLDASPRAPKIPMKAEVPPTEKRQPLRESPSPATARPERTFAPARTEAAREPESSPPPREAARPTEAVAWPPDASFGEQGGRVRSGRQSRRGNQAPNGGKAPGLTIFGNGKIEKSSVERTLERHLAYFQDCYAQSLAKNPKATGVLEVEWAISRTGVVSAASVLRSELNDETLHQCVLEELRRTTFARPDGDGVKVRFPLVFSNGTF